MKLKSFMFLIIAAVFAAAVCFSSSLNLRTAHAEDFENPKAGAVKWKVVDYNRIQTHPARIPDKIPGGIAFDFLNTPDTALLGTSHPSYKGDLLGDMSAKTLSARVGVTVTSGTVFQYYGNSTGLPASVRFYFQTDTSGKFEETDYWWSNPVAIDLQTLKNIQPGDFPLSTPFSSPSMWSDYNGHFGNDPAYTTAFIQATKDVQFVGLSFGGGSFFENGVGIQAGTGSGSFRLMDFTATP